ncbi:XRE family transcriptional regulator [Melissococcus plutonius]|uniref:XRE family transcriptional regulator n=1 Tax=Melissococcus plutonius TaxID=33970 RepID=UPI00065E8148|nr:XRE family transcriptional regulator [Melissococcus plutonius]KMT32938.1 repressor protein [Melissococcus plutonius]
MRTNDDIINILIDEKNKKNLSISELARRVNMAKSALSRYFNKTREFPLNRADDFANALGITTEYLLGFEQDDSSILYLISSISSNLKEPRQKIVLKTAEQQLNEQKQEQQSNIIPFDNSSNDDQLTSFNWCGYVSAGTGEFLDGNERKSIIQLPKSDIPQNADFAVTVNGDSMKPVFKNHETIFVEKTTDLSSGSIGIVVVEGEAFVKKIYIHDDCITLVSLNPTYKDKVIKDAQSIKVIGRVIL